MAEGEGEDGLVAEEDVGEEEDAVVPFQVVRKFLKWLLPKLGLDHVPWRKDCRLSDK